MTRTTLLFAASALSIASACARTAPAPRVAARDHGSEHPRGTAPDAALEAVARIHGGHGPFAVAGYRIGARALEALGLERGSFDLEVVHESPPEVQWSCIADGVQAATGASVGRMSLRRVDSADGGTRTRLRNRRTGVEVVGVLTPSFRDDYLNTPRSQLMDAGASVMTLPDDAVFSLTSTAPAH